MTRRTCMGANVGESVYCDKRRFRCPLALIEQHALSATFNSRHPRRNDTHNDGPEPQSCTASLTGQANEALPRRCNSSGSMTDLRSRYEQRYPTLHCERL